MRNDKEGSTTVDLDFLFKTHRARLQGIAASRLGGDNDDADEVVQQTFIFAMKRSEMVPEQRHDQMNWLARVLEYRIRQLQERQSKNSGLGTRKDNPSVPTRDRRESGTYGHYLATAARDRCEQPSIVDEVLAGLSKDDREVLFDSPIDANTRRRRAELLENLRDRFARSSLIGVAEPGPSMRVLSFIEYYSNRRQTAWPRDYISQFRVLERRHGRVLRLADLDAEFFDRHVAGLSESSRKRVLAVWNAAAKMSLIDPPTTRIGENAREPVYWTADELKRVLLVAENLAGVVGRTRIPKAVYWPAAISLAADSGWHYSALRCLTWSALWSSKHITVKTGTRTVERLQRLETLGYVEVLPWLARKEVFHKYYASILRKAGMVNALTMLEAEVLKGIRAGQVESELARKQKCHVGVIRQYRRRIREKLGLPPNAKSQLLVSTAVERGLLVLQ